MPALGSKYMDNAHKQLVLAKREDWNISLSSNIRRDGNHIQLEEGLSFGFFCLKAIDSGENGFAWARISLECVIPEDSMIRAYAYASDSRLFDGNRNFDDYLATLDATASRGLLDGIYSSAGNGDDLYLSVSGRYLWLMFEFITSGLPPVLEILRIHMSGDHMIDYLPEIYRKDGDFAKRFLSVFDSVHMDMERAIYELPAQLNFMGTSDEMLRFLARWVCVEPSDLERSAIIERIKSIPYEYESMFTPQGIMRSVERLCSKRPIIIESADVDPNKPGCVHSELYRKLYGENPYKFFILLEEDSFDSRTQTERFIQEMQRLIPAHTEFDLVLLKRGVRLDGHTYLGVNSFVSDYSTVIIDENTAIDYDSTIGGTGIERL